ncbi:hypothetical protein PoB_004217300 [Plakobranchus ocellatus]|uniref:Uncharacterized protein n=1 Tax=Plakobranchus ocellatus TaxID=259542 RepID=A0AAV4B7T8_9GAST|nr:hypothetical protein PoB_004217300 [Plakobranchus ocellatus]
MTPGVVLDILEYVNIAGVTQIRSFSHQHPSLSFREWRTTGLLSSGCCRMLESLEMRADSLANEARSQQQPDNPNTLTQVGKILLLRNAAQWEASVMIRPMDVRKLDNLVVISQS